MQDKIDSVKSKLAATAAPTHASGPDTP